MIGLLWPLTKPPFGSCAIYFHYGYYGEYLLIMIMTTIITFVIHNDVFKHQKQQKNTKDHENTAKNKK